LSSQDCPGACTIIKGRFTTAANTIGLADIPLEVVWENTTSNGIGKSGVFRRKATGRTDANGYYEIKFLLRDDELTDGFFLVNYKIDPKKYIVPQESGFALDLKRDTTFMYDYLIPQKAFVELQVANREAIKSSDYFSSTFSFDLGIAEPQSISQRYGVVVSLKDYTQSIIEVAGDQPVIIRTTKEKDSIRTFQSDTISIPSGQKYIFNTQF
jgi:hypothetical protein